MKTNIKTAINSQIDATYETSKFALGVILSSAVLLGIWSCACLTSAIANEGIITVVKGFIGTIS